MFLKIKRIFPRNPGEIVNIVFFFKFFNFFIQSNSFHFIRLKSIQRPQMPYFHA